MSLRIQGTMAYTSSSSENSLLNKLAWSRKNKFLGQLHRSMTSKFSSPSDRDSSAGGDQQAAFSSSSARQSRNGAASHIGRPRPSTTTSRGGFASDERSTRDGMTDYVYEEDADEKAEEARHGSKSGSDVEIEDITDAPRSPPANYSRPRPAQSPQSTPNIDKSPERPPPPPPKHQKKTLPGDPAYVAPIGKIGPIGSTPKIASRSNSEKGGISVSPSSRPQLPPYIGSYLKGKTVDEYGDIIDPRTGTILAHAGGDLPSIVGRQVSNDQGDILGDEGELLGYVADVEVGKKTASPEEAAPKPMMSLAEIMSRNNTALMVDHDGNILDAQGNVVGKFLDHNNPVHRERQEKEEDQKGEGKGKGRGREEERGVPVPHYEEADKDEKEGAAEEEPQREQSRPPRRTEEERRANAAAWRKENPGESPSDIFLDVKSTTEGIQLTIRIPTVFGNGQQLKPNISFS
ncbi:hypothetical protein NEUTE1DRAFT_79624 [Neurospora tetrasperma FGSC 2508]|uniref:Uncharacterized protein n=1 Tax=Neurospora tetrasperma (strain FGSC 2508 / ATCC MYA-4615 / P0657) TaxID=510951 RepID=F8MGQ9_NEUT8|nr:uncharacterized protein NEUTE1DRAFT_79624 [Neurospora tetrasperma FGSC 2508]EGO59478.1 hypothetical protein NEUTE1DRAFT_79624 [Neurospora tetrasperma FGSC 2508]EGZ73603.1 hypothetical protein NEUTE2DRAFT_157038 [Neurospora tetrasperma FGSC 2509]